MDRQRSQRCVLILTTVMLVSSGCRSSSPELRRPRFVDAHEPVTTSRPDGLRRSEGLRRRSARRITAAGSRLDPRVAQSVIRLRFDRVPLEEALAQLATVANLEFIFDPEALDGLEVRLDLESTVRELLDRLEAMYPVVFRREGRTIEVQRGRRDEFEVLVFALPDGLVRRQPRPDFDSLRQLSFVSRSQRAASHGVDDRSVDRSAPSASGDGGSAPAAAESPRALHHLDAFLRRLPELVPWPEGSRWYFDERRNSLLVRSTPSTLDLVESLLLEVTQPPPQVHVETRFVEMSEEDALDLGVELGLLADYAVRRKNGDPKVVVGDGSATRFGLAGASAAAEGLRLSLLGLLSEPQFSSVLHAIEVEGAGEVLSAPSVTTLNNSRATMAITTNLPYVEDYRPVIDRELVASDGLSRSEQSVALVAQINDENYTGIVLNVTPSVGAETDHVKLRLQPVVRDRVGEISISEGALVEGIATPAIARPIIETRFLDTQLSIPDGSTVVLGGLKKSVTRRTVTGVPILRHVPLLGRLFEREVFTHERRDLVIFVTARVARR